MLTPMDWVGFLIAIISGSVTAGGAIFGMRVQIATIKESHQRDIKILHTEAQKSRERIDKEAQESRERIDKEAQKCRERIDNLITSLANRKDIELLHTEAQECRERINDLLTLLANREPTTRQ